MPIWGNKPNNIPNTTVNENANLKDDKGDAENSEKTFIGQNARGDVNGGVGVGVDVVGSGGGGGGNGVSGGESRGGQGENSGSQTEATQQQSAVNVPVTEGRNQTNAQTAAPISAEPPNGAPQAQAAAQHQVDTNSAKIIYLDILYDDLLTDPNKKNIIDESEYHIKYNDFKKNYDAFQINENEYEIIKKIIDSILRKGTDAAKKNTVITDIFKNILSDEKFEEKFKNLIYGVYIFAKRHSYLNAKKIDNDNKFFGYVGDMMNTL
ncbi:MSP7-like protein, putative [Plasmodium malariae]|uniref:MSP7-like protein, putative n=1 Tax=Plasmodium malariae TaxID=5858 RepID=A0A1C3L0K9_PLAMA|nr:MSP7-like protein, putative [Plasmodium malariae]